MKAGADGKFPYSGLFDALRKTASNEGVAKLWVGFPTYYTRIAPHVMITLLMQDFLTDLAKRHWWWWKELSFIKLTIYY